MSENCEMSTNETISETKEYDQSDVRFSVLTFTQVKKLSSLLSENIPIYGKGNFPTINANLFDIVITVCSKLIDLELDVKEVRLNGSCASSVLASEFNDSYIDSGYNDVDLIFNVDLATVECYDKVKTAVLTALLDLHPCLAKKEWMPLSTLQEAYVFKMVKVNQKDKWSLFSLGNNSAKIIELKFVSTMKRKYQFSVDSFHIILDPLLILEKETLSCEEGNDGSNILMQEDFYPTVSGESMFGDFKTALSHLQMKLIETRNPEEIRGGGLLKYCNLLSRNYRPAFPEKIQSMERYMCSRFFIDFSDATEIQQKLENYLRTRFRGPDGDMENERLKYDYLMILYQVIEESTICLPGCERTSVLGLIEEMAYGIYNSIFFWGASFYQPQMSYLFRRYDYSMGGTSTADQLYDISLPYLSYHRGSLSSASTLDDAPFSFGNHSIANYTENFNTVKSRKRSRKNRKKQKNNTQ